MTPRGTDWWLAALVALLAVTGVMTWFAATAPERWVFALHDAGGLALGGVLFWKTRRVWQRVADRPRWDERTGAGLAAALLVGAALGSGVAWSTGANTSPLGYTLLAWHAVLGALLAAVVLGHALVRAKPLRARDVADRRQFLATIGVGAAAVAAWRVQRPLAGALGLGGQNRRFTGSYEDSGVGEFPVTSWLGDDPRELDPARYRLAVEPLNHGHGAPARLIAPRRRGFQWVKWVTRVELADGPDPGAIASTVWSSFTPEGRGSA